MSNTEKKKMIEAENLIKIYKTEEIEVVALQGLDLTVEEGELMAIIGNSGSGKSTLLKILAGIEKPDNGSVASKKNLTVAYVPQAAHYPSMPLTQVLLDQCENLGTLTEIEKHVSPRFCQPACRRRHLTMTRIP